MAKSAPRILLRIALLLGLFAIALPTTHSCALAQSAPAPPIGPAVAKSATAAAEADVAIAEADDWIHPEDVADRSDTLLRRLDARKPGPSTVAAIEKIETGLTAIDPDLDDAFEQARVALAGHSSLMAIQDTRRDVQGSSAQISAWKDQVMTEAKRMADVLEEVAPSQQRWERTLARPEIAQAGDAVVQRVRTLLATLAATTTEMKTWRARVLALNDRIVEHSAAIADALDKLEAATVAQGTSMLVADHPPLWRRGLVAQLASELPQVPQRYRDFQKSTSDYVAGDPRPFVLQVVIALVLMFLFRDLPKHARKRLERSQVSPETARLLERPFAIAILLALVISPTLHPTAPHRVMQLLGMLALIPVARILMLASQRADLSLYAGLFVLLLLDRLAFAITALPALTLVVLLVDLGLAIGIGVAYRRRLVQEGGNPWAIGLMTTGLTSLGIAILAEIGGWTSLAAVLGRGVLASGMSALYVYAATISLEALFAYALASPALRHSRFVDRNQPLVQRWTALALRFIGAAFWIRLALSSLGIRDLAADALDTVLNAGVSAGTMSLSIGGVLAFVMTLVAAMIVSRLVHEVLEDEVFPRTNLPRGIPHALLTLTNYAVYSLGFLLALAAGGVQLSQLAFLLGGLGVGLGLGLQDVVKNFAAGITILLERRVHVGDAVQIAGKDVFGRVLSIGMRASVVRNWNGTEVVMPNDDLVSSTVTNWTLSDSLHRLQVSVGVAYGSDPDQIIALLLAVAHADPRVLATPPPSALFKGFGESTLDFQLNGWSDEAYESTGSRTSELGLAVYRALRDAGIDIRFPQREVNLASVSPQGSAALGGSIRKE